MGFRGVLVPLLLFTVWAVPWAARAEIPRALETRLRQDLQGRSGLGFGAVLSRWEKDPGPRAAPLLFRIASEPDLADSDRYIALIAGAKLQRASGGVVTTQLVPFLSDDSWMVRNAALVALREFGEAAHSEPALLLVEDPALVVRLEAVRTLQALRPFGTAAALLRALELADNYDSRKQAIWVPEAALRALGAIGAKEAIPALRPYLLHFEDPGLQLEVIRTLETLTGTREDGPLPAQVLKWERRLRMEFGALISRSPRS